MTTRLPLVIVLTLVFASFAHAQTTASPSRIAVACAQARYEPSAESTGDHRD